MNQKTNLQELDTRTNYMCNYMCLTKKKKERKNKHEDKIQTILEIESQAPCLSNPGLRVSHYVSEKKNPHKFHLNPSRTKKKKSQRDSACFPSLVFATFFISRPVHSIAEWSSYLENFHIVRLNSFSS